jgi:hypothetical protein
MIDQRLRYNLGRWNLKLKGELNHKVWPAQGPSWCQGSDDEQFAQQLLETNSLQGCDRKSGPITFAAIILNSRRKEGNRSLFPPAKTLRPVAATMSKTRRYTQTLFLGVKDRCQPKSENLDVSV